MNLLKTIFLLSIASIWPAFSLAAEIIPVEQFIKDSSFKQVKISPDGRYLAATVPLEKLTALVVMDLQDKKITGSFKPQDKAHIEDFYWVSPTRLLFNSAVREGRDARPTSTGAWYAMNADGSKIGTAYGRGYYADLLDTIKDDDKYVLMQYPSDSGSMTIGRMNVENGDILPTFRKPPVAGYGSYVADNAAEARLYLSGKNYKDTKVYVRASEAWDWTQLHESKTTGQDFTFMAFSADNSVVYFSLSEKTGPDAVYSYNLKTAEKKLVSRDDNVNPGGILSSPVDDAPYAIYYQDGFPRFEWIDKTNPYAQALQKMQASFKDAVVFPVSSTTDGSKVVYQVESDTIAGEFYLYDVKTQKAEYLVSRLTWLDPEKMALMEPMKFKARDGLELEAFLTMPRGSNGKDLPLIIHPHGGPFGPFDAWGFNPELQMLANRGYAVLQVNFRGSGNYGKEFKEKGYKQWGKTMQDDLTDATHWAIAQGIADPSRICIYGASYGGYAALMGVVKEPGLYRCAIGNVGVYDLPMQLNYSTNGGGGMNPLKAFFGDVAQDKTAEVSPARFAGSIRVPVLLAAGEKDTTCPPEQTEAMYAALKKANVPVEMTIYPGEGHGNVLKENRIDFAKKLVAFLDANIGDRGKVKASDLKPIK